jgi:hypothetical protein
MIVSCEGLLFLGGCLKGALSKIIKRILVKFRLHHGPDSIN